MEATETFVQDRVRRMRGAMRLYEIATNINMRDVAAARVIHYLRDLEKAGVFGPDVRDGVDVQTGRRVGPIGMDDDPDAPVPYTVTSEGVRWHHS